MVERLVESDLRVTDVPINPETKSRLDKLDRLGITLLEAELRKVVKAT